MQSGNSVITKILLYVGGGCTIIKPTAVTSQAVKQIHYSKTDAVQQQLSYIKENEIKLKYMLLKAKTQTQTGEKAWVNHKGTVV